MNGKKLIGVRSLIAFMWAIASLVVIAKWMPEAMAAVSAVVVSLFGILIGRQKTNGGDNV